MLKFIKKAIGISANTAEETAEAKDPKPMGPIADKPELIKKDEPSSEKGWIGVDLDGTLAKFDGWYGFEHVGKPIPGMVIRIKHWLQQGYNVKIMTARASDPRGIEPVKAWLVEIGLPPLEVTCKKDFQMIELWDDRAVQVVANSGSPVLSPRWGALPRAPLFGIESKKDEAEAIEKQYEDSQS